MSIKNKECYNKNKNNKGESLNSLYPHASFFVFSPQIDIITTKNIKDILCLSATNLREG